MEVANTIGSASEAFVQACKAGPDYVCDCCNRLMYRKTVAGFSVVKYPKMQAKIMEAITIPSSSYHTTNEKIWICRTCDSTLRRGLMPVQSKVNNLQLQNIPSELQDLNQLDTRLICLRIPFMKMVALPTGKQRCIHGPAVNVPTDLSSVCNLLPRLPSQCQILPMKLKRKLQYRGHYMYDFIRPDKGIAALQWLKMNSPLYKDIEVNSEWVEQAATDNRTLWYALTAHHEDADDTTPQGVPEDGHTVNVTPDGDLPDHSTTSSNSQEIPMPLSSMFSLIKSSTMNTHDDFVYL